VIFEARNICCYDADNPERKRVDDISFTLRKGEILGIAGLVGAGRTELVSAIFGAYPGPYDAEVWLNGQKLDTSTPLKAIRAGLAMVPEDRKHHGIVPRPRRRPEHDADGAERLRARHAHRPAGGRRSVRRSSVKLKTASPSCRSPASRAATSRRRCCRRCC
jgi:ABC-type sugar transport system ATPase subunit